MTTNYDASPEATTAPKSDTDYKYPSIPLGSHVISPIKLNSFSDGCLVSATSVFPPKYFALDSVGLWSCNIPELEPLLWDVDIWPVDLHDAELSQLGSVPDTLVCGKWEDSRWGSYLISSREGEYKEEKKNTVYVSVGGEKVIYNKPDGFREGLQGLAFYNQPLAYLNSTKSNPPNSKRAVVNSLDSYKFGVLYNKTVILRESTMQKTWKTGGSYPFKNGNGTELLIGEKVWMCVWEKTMLEVEIMINQTSTAYNQKNTSVNHAADHSGDDGYDTDNDDPESTMTTITVGLPDATSTPTTVKLTEEFEFVVTDTENSEDEEEIDFKSILNLSKRHFKHRNLLNPRYPSHGKVKRGRTVQEYTRKVYVTEYRPTPEQIRLALGIDKTDPPAMLAQLVPGPISCRKMIVQGDRGLREFNSDTEVISVDLREDVDAFLGLEKRSFVGSPDDTGCRCSWES